MGTLKLSNRTVSLLLCLLLQGGVFAAKLGLEDAQPLQTGDVPQKSPANDAKEGETAAAPLAAAAEGKGPLPTEHAVDAGPEKPAGDGQGDKGKKQPVVVHHPVLADAQQLPGVELSAGPPAAVAQGPLQPQQGHPPPQAGAAPGMPAGSQAPEKSHAATSPQQPQETKPLLLPEGAQKSPSSTHVAGPGQAPGDDQAPGNDLANAGTVTHDANQAKGNVGANLPSSQRPTSAPTTKTTKPAPTTTVEPSGPSPAEPSRPSEDKGLLNAKPTNTLLDVAKDSDGVPPPSPGVADYSHAREPDSEEELEPLAPKEPSSPVLGGAASVGAQSVAGPGGDSRPEKPLDASGASGSVSFPPAQDDSHFFAYFLTAVVLCVVGYLAFHNKRKILALILEGRHERQRRHNGHYRRLDNVDDTSSSRKGRGSF